MNGREFICFVIVMGAVAGLSLHVIESNHQVDEQNGYIRCLEN